jgi:hypothetical protein
LEELCKIIKVALTKELGKKCKVTFKIPKMENNLRNNNRLFNSGVPKRKDTIFTEVDP